MSGSPARPDPLDARVVTAQLGRVPRGSWSVCARCRFGRPMAIAVAPLLENGEPFPTAAWLTCPWLVDAIGRLESGGEASRWAERIESDESLRRLVLAADEAYRDWRRELGGGQDPCADVGVAGQAEPTRVKCLHARAAAFLAGCPDPVGQGVLATIEMETGSMECPDDRCR